MAEHKQETKAEERKPMGWLELLGEFHHTMKASMGGSLPPEFWQHVRASHKERLLAARSLIDSKIAYLEERERAAEERKATKIAVK